MIQTKQQMKLYHALSERMFNLLDEEGQFFFEARPWMTNPYYPKPWEVKENLEREARRQRIVDKIDKVLGELHKLYVEMYPPHLYPEMNNIPVQQTLLEDGETKQLPQAAEQPKDLVELAKEIFGVEDKDITTIERPKQIQPLTEKGKKLLEEFKNRSTALK